MGSGSAGATLAVVLVVGVGARVLADALRVPPMLLLLAAGVLLGPSALGVLDVSLGSQGAHLAVSLGVCLILFEGGLGLSTAVLGRVVGTLLMLAGPGVLVTAGLAGAAAAVAFRLPLEQGLLIGAVLAPTDPAILVPLLSGLGIRPKVVQTVVAESALNDPTGAMLALALASGGTGLLGPMRELAVDLVVSTALGLGAGAALALALSTSRSGVLREAGGLGALAMLAVLVAVADASGASAFLGAFLAGLVVSGMDRLGLEMHREHDHELRVVVRVLGELAVIGLFVALGASLPLHELGGQLGPALLVTGVLVLVARPLAVAACLLPVRRRSAWTLREAAFVSATRETGVMPAALAAAVIGLGLPEAEALSATVAVAVVVTLGLLAPVKPRLAARLGLLARAEPAGAP
jgi:cell volume regulation protein A